MLVLTRKQNEKSLFPTVGATVQVLSAKPGVVRLGIEAPPDVTILREELRQQAAAAGAAEKPPGGARVTALFHEVSHLLRNRLGTLGVGLALAQRQLQAGLAQGAEATLARTEAEYLALRERLEDSLESERPRPPTNRCTGKALLVEDDRNECELLASLLRFAGMTVETAGDGADALDYLRTRGRPDVVLLDMVLPRCDGPTTVRQIRREPAWAGLKIFGVTGHSPNHFELESGPSGVDRWFRKPLDTDRLLRELSEELESPANLY
jgi:carbon storage regulator CsrA